MKIIRPELLSREDAVKRFLRESRILLDLDHPNLVRGLEVGFSEGLYFLAMEYVAGRSLRRRIESEGSVPEAEALAILVQVVQALSAVEARRYMHRDIKPANILLASSGKAMLCDLGLARSIGAKTSTSLTATGFIVGTPDYISPEQALGRDDIDIRSDIYSLGATLYHALVGNVPFYNRSPIEVMLKHVYEPIVPPRSVRPGISARTSALVVKMMAKEPKDRYSGTAALLKALG
ncbi:MAG: serine/threonine protein kinase [Planctomycetes bacterium]|nr:serine/threonine protein kinase [Planctomycetota bacterium]